MLTKLAKKPAGVKRTRTLNNMLLHECLIPCKNNRDIDKKQNDTASSEVQMILFREFNHILLLDVWASPIPSLSRCFSGNEATYKKLIQGSTREGRVGTMMSEIFCERLCDSYVIVVRCCTYMWYIVWKSVCFNDSLGIIAFSGSILYSMCGFLRGMLEHIWPVFEPSQLVNRMLRGLPSINSTFMINRGWCTIPQMLWKACAWRRTCQPGRSEFDTFSGRHFFTGEDLLHEYHRVRKTLGGGNAESCDKRYPIAILCMVWWKFPS